MQKTLAEIAELVGGEVVGDKKLVITGVNGIQEAKEGELTFVANSKYVPIAKETKASAIIISRDMSIPGKTVIFTDNPSSAFTEVISLFASEAKSNFKGIHSSAVISEDAFIGNNVSIGPNVIIEEGVSVGDDCIVYGGVFIGIKATIGQSCIFYPNVVIMDRCEIGNNVIIHSQTVIGSDGFGYEQVDGKHKKIPQTGIVVIEDDVEIGAHVAVDRARFDKTFIGRGTKIDNLVQVAHNVSIGEDCIIISQVGISGSVNIGKNAILAGQVGVVGHLTIGEGAIVAAQSAVMKSVAPFTKALGSPARLYSDQMKINACAQKLPSYVKEIKVLKKQIKELKEKIDDGS